MSAKNIGRLLQYGGSVIDTQTKKRKTRISLKSPNIRGVLRGLMIN